MTADKTFQGDSVCPRCGRSFTCGMRAGHAKCWCAELPHLPPPDPDAPGCYCPECLRRAIDESHGRAGD